MTREEQRYFTVVAARVKGAATGTLSSTIELAADDLDNLIRFDAGVQLFKDYPAKVRRRMARAGQALPDGSFPIADCRDAADAIHSVGRTKNRSRAETHIRKRVRALGCSGGIYENWK